jgi:hypothetical protein
MLHSINMIIHGVLHIVLDGQREEDVEGEGRGKGVGG